MFYLKKRKKGEIKIIKGSSLGKHVISLNIIYLPLFNLYFPISLFTLLIYFVLFTISRLYSFVLLCVRIICLAYLFSLLHCSSGDSGSVQNMASSNRPSVSVIWSSTGNFNNSPGKNSTWTSSINTQPS